MAQFRFEAIGTTWDVEFEGVNDAEALMARVHARIDEFDRAYSRFRSDSLVTLMSKKAGTYMLPEDAKPMLELYFSIYKTTLGAVTPLIGQALSDAGYDAEYSLQTKTMRTPPALEEVLEYSHPILVVKKPVLLDFGAAGKGYLVDIIASMLKDAGVTSGVVDAGGDIAAFGREEKIALEDPNDATRAVGVAHIGNQSICGSSGNRRAWGKFTHILDPQSLTSPTHIAAVWVAADTTMLADAMTTCLYFTPASTLLRQYQFEYLLLRQGGSVEKSPRFPAELFER